MSLHTSSQPRLALKKQLLAAATALALCGTSLAAPQVTMPRGYIDPGAFDPAFALDDIILPIRDAATGQLIHPVKNAVAQINDPASGYSAGDHIGVIIPRGVYDSFGFGPGSQVGQGTADDDLKNMFLTVDVHLHLIAQAVSTQPNSGRLVRFRPAQYTPGSGVNVQVQQDFNHPWQGRFYSWFCDFTSQGNSTFAIGNIPTQRLTSNEGDILIKPVYDGTNNAHTRPFQKAYFHGCRFIDHPSATAANASKWCFQIYRASIEHHEVTMDQEHVVEHFVYLHGTYEGAINGLFDSYVLNCGGQVWQQTARSSLHRGNNVFDGVYTGKSTTYIVGNVATGFGNNSAKASNALAFYSTGCDVEIVDNFFWKNEGHRYGGYAVLTPSDEKYNEGPGFLVASSPYTASHFFGMPDPMNTLPHGTNAAFVDSGDDCVALGGQPGYIQDPGSWTAPNLLYGSNNLCEPEAYPGIGIYDEVKLPSGAGAHPGYHQGSITIDTTYFYNFFSSKSTLSVADTQKLTVTDSFLGCTRPAPPVNAGFIVVGGPNDVGGGIGSFEWIDSNNAVRKQKLLTKLTNVGVSTTLADLLVGPILKPCAPYSVTYSGNPSCWMGPFDTQGPQNPANSPSDLNYGPAEVTW